MLLVACGQVFEEGVKANAFPLLIEMLETVWARLSQEGGAGAVDDETLATQLLCASLSQTQKGRGLLRSEGLRVDVMRRTTDFAAVADLSGLPVRHTTRHPKTRALHGDNV